MSQQTPFEKNNHSVSSEEVPELNISKCCGCSGEVGPAAVNAGSRAEGWERGVVLCWSVLDDGAFDGL